MPCGRARALFFKTMGRAEFAGDRIVLTRNGRPACAIVPMVDLEKLRQADNAQAKKPAVPVEA
jgi:antitoxin (DNA-binding transcriptional repressor) of toxin-antitoxin stability system